MFEHTSPAPLIEKSTDTMPDAKRRVFESALACFGANGRAGARIDEIVRRSRVNVRMIYHYFGSKDGLYDDVLAAAFHSRNTALRAAHSVADVWEIEECIAAMLSWHGDQPILSRILDWESCDNWGWSSNAIEAETEAPHDLAPQDLSGSWRNCIRTMHDLSTPWSRLGILQEVREQGPEFRSGIISRIAAGLKCVDTRSD
jgi:AcrR family transcriptional regulator